MGKKQLLAGLILGILIPVGGALLYTILFSELSVSSSFEVLKTQNRIGSVLTLGALPSLLLFFVCIRKGREMIARGILLGTFLWAIVMVILKFF